MYLLPLLAALFAFTPAAATLRHPHFPKKVEMQLGFDPSAGSLSVSHLTVTFDKEGFEQMPAGGAWHLANGHFTTTETVTVGGRKVEPGDYRLLARKKQSGEWELMLDPGGKDFSREMTTDAVALETEFKKEQPLHEHMRIDLQPSGNEENAVIHLEVHFDTFAAVTQVVVE